MLVQKTLSPVDNSVLVERPLARPSELSRIIERASLGGSAWTQVSLPERQALLSAAVDAFVAKKDELAEELTWQMGRPITQTPGEIDGFAHRARTLIDLSTSALTDVVPPEKAGFRRYIRREPLGTVLVLAPWNYPYLTAVNAVWPALLAGNSVILKHSDQTPLCAERIGEALEAAGLPDGVFQFVHMSHELTADVVRDSRVNHVAFTGSVGGGHAVHEAAAGTFTTVGLELGGKDPGYVRPDADIARAAEGLIDGAMYNAGQSCCGVERIYVHKDVYDAFVEAAIEAAGGLVLGNPTESATTLGPVVRTRSANAIRAQIKEAISAGATATLDAADFPADQEGTPYLAPQVLLGVDHTMELMREETFGPAVGIMKVKSDEEAIALMNDSRYGLTASVWTDDLEAAESIGRMVETGTFFMNRCDYLDPELAWVGVKDSGRGCTLSRIGFEHLTRPKSFHLRF